MWSKLLLQVSGFTHLRLLLQPAQRNEDEILSDLILWVGRIMKMCFSMGAMGYPNLKKGWDAGGTVSTPHF